MRTKTAKPKKPFLSGYKTYKPEEEGYGNARQWKSTFYQRMTGEEIEEILQDDSPWSILGLKEGATQWEIKVAYRKMAMEWHPDRHPDNVAAATINMQKINAAYNKLYHS